MKMLRKALAALAIAGILAAVLRLRGSGGTPPQEGGWRELTDLHQRVLANIQLALNVLVSGDRESARQLVAEKDRMRDLERRSQDCHLKRLQTGTVQSIETSEIHLETIRALKQINSLFASVASSLARSSSAFDCSRRGRRSSASFLRCSALARNRRMIRSVFFRRV